MSTVHCPLCGLRFRSGGELDEHARDAHAPAPPPEGRETLRVTRRHAEERPVDQVLARRA